MTGSRYSFFAINPLGPYFEFFSAESLWARTLDKRYICILNWYLPLPTLLRAPIMDKAISDCSILLSSLKWNNKNCNLIIPHYSNVLLIAKIKKKNS